MIRQDYLLSSIITFFCVVRHFKSLNCSTIPNSRKQSHGKFNFRPSVGRASILSIFSANGSKPYFTGGSKFKFMVDPAPGIVVPPSRAMNFAKTQVAHELAFCYSNSQLGEYLKFDRVARHTSTDISIAIGRI